MVFGENKFFFAQIMPIVTKPIGLIKIELLSITMNDFGPISFPADLIMVPLPTTSFVLRS